MHGEAGSAHCLDYNFRTKLKVHISSPSSCPEIREVRKLSRYIDSWQTAEIRAKMSDLPRPGFGSMFYFPSATVTHEQPNQPRGRLDSKQWPEVLVPNSFLVSILWSHQLMLTERRVGPGQSLMVGKGQGSVGQGKFLKGLRTSP